jgi:hypothetical protein
MDLIELIQKIGLDNLKVQNLNQSLDGKQSVTRHGTRLTLMTDETLADLTLANKRIGLILWVDKDRLAEAMNDPTPGARNE